MNKTAILSFILDEVALKCRNVSKNMRKRIHWMLKHKEITVKKYDERAIILNGWIRVWKGATKTTIKEEIKKGVSNYELSNLKEMERVMILNNEIRCSTFKFILTNPIELESIEDLTIFRSDYDIYSKFSFNKVKCLKLHYLLTEQIKFILTRIKRIDKLEISKSSLKTIDFRSSRIKEFSFSDVPFKGPVYLPKEIAKLTISHCKSANLVIAQRVTAINFNGVKRYLRDYEELTKSLKGVKIVVICSYLTKYFASLPCSVRKIHISGNLNTTDVLNTIDDLQQIVQNFPYLIDLGIIFPIQAVSNAKLRAIEPIMRCSEEKFKLRPKKIVATSANVFQLSSHPELFEKVECVAIRTKRFNLDILPSEIKRIEIRREIDEESIILNRFEKERE